MKRFYLRYRRFFLVAICFIFSFVLFAIYKAAKEPVTVSDDLAWLNRDNMQTYQQTQVTTKEVMAEQKASGQELKQVEKIKFAKRQRAESTQTEITIQVDLKGEIKCPGIYKIGASCNLADLIALAGGLTNEAAADYLNLVMPLEDQQLYRIPSSVEIANLETLGQSYTLKPGVLQVLPTDYVQRLHLTNNKNINSESNETEKLFNLNRLGQDELAKIPHVGPKLAARIISYRNEHGDFTNLQSLLNVKGIKAKKLQQLKKYLSCN